MVYPEMDETLGLVCISTLEADTLGNKMNNKEIQHKFEDMLNFCEGNCVTACNNKINKACSKLYPLMAISRYFFYNICIDESNKKRCSAKCQNETTSFRLSSCIEIK
jgi:hypothetical protein